MKRLGRKKPYTNEEIATIPCCRCGEPAVHQWQCCANDNRWVPVCLRCDVDANFVFLSFFKIPHRSKLMSEYRKKKGMLHLRYDQRRES